MSNLEKVPNVDIDASGRFKYILIQVKDPKTNTSKNIVRGYKSCPYHIDIFDRVTEELSKLGLETKCLGGGRIIHKPEVKSLFIYGYSQGYGRADHTKAEKLVKERFPDYTDISWSNEGY